MEVTIIFVVFEYLNIFLSFFCCGGMEGREGGGGGRAGCRDYCKDPVPPW